MQTLCLHSIHVLKDRQEKSEFVSKENRPVVSGLHPLLSVRDEAKS